MGCDRRGGGLVNTPDLFLSPPLCCALHQGNITFNINTTDSSGMSTGPRLILKVVVFTYLLLNGTSKAHTEVDSQIWALIDQWQEECSEVVGGSRDGRRPRPATCDEAELNGARGQHTCGNEWVQLTRAAPTSLKAKLSIRAVENMNILREATADRQPGSREEKHVNANWNERQSQLSTQKPSSKPPGAAAKKLAGLPRVASWLHTTDHIERRSCQSEQTLRQSWSDTKHVVSTVNKQTIFRQSGSADVILMCRVLRGVALRGSGFGEGPGKAPIEY
ncbi:hypothetical protein Bbelb_433000 [Branchiostoma belcheri]|nr:hypothetical protein Bbelb_433000 [Branchiostoma belcheri]